MPKTFRSVTDTFVDVIVWNRATGLRRTYPFDGATAEYDARTFAKAIGDDIILGRGPYKQVTLELKTCTTWEMR